MAQQTPTVCCWYIKQSRLAPTCWKKPSGEVNGLITATQTAAEAEQQAAETSAALPDEADYPSE